MIDVNKKVREAFMNVLDATIDYNGLLIPCYNEENPNDDELLYIILHTQTEEDNSNKSSFDTVGTILVDIVNKTDSTTFNVVDTVAGEVMNLIQPTPSANGISASGVQIWNVRKLSSQTLPFRSDGENIMRRLIRYEYKTTE